MLLIPSVDAPDHFQPVSNYRANARKKGAAESRGPKF
jgi:hypothetical protein